MRERTTAPTSSLSLGVGSVSSLSISARRGIYLSLCLFISSLSSVRRRGFTSGRHTVASHTPLASGAVYGGGVDGWRQRRPGGGGEEAKLDQI